MSGHELPKPGDVFQEKASPNTEVKSQKILKSSSIPQYRVVEKEYGSWLLVLIILILIFVAFKLSHVQLYSMQSDSMESIVPKGSLVIVREVDPETIGIDDVISFVSSEGMIATHQVVAIEEDVDGNIAFRTQGVENELIDRDIVTIGQLKGKMICHIPGVGKIFNIKNLLKR